MPQKEAEKLKLNVFKRSVPRRMYDPRVDTQTGKDETTKRHNDERYEIF